MKTERTRWRCAAEGVVDAVGRLIQALLAVFLPQSRTLKFSELEWCQSLWLPAVCAPLPRACLEQDRLIVPVLTQAQMWGRTIPARATIRGRSLQRLDNLVTRGSNGPE